MAAISQILNGLNDSQKQAVTTAEGPVLIVAGPGTGKTLTIVRRIAWLIHQGVRPESIIAVTFTNRAAREMKERTGALLGEAASGTFIGTFHLLGLKILRENLPGDFVLYNRDEQIALLKTVHGGSVKKARQAAGQISKMKNYVEDADEEMKDILERYQTALGKDNAFDFDDLILRPVEMFADHAILERYHDRFRHIIVDEYQDISPAQYRLLRLLSGSAGNICAVGDSDQAIYAFRGADIQNFLNFEKDHPSAKRVTLTESYRTTEMILNASDALIKNNQKRIDKELTPAREQGSRATVISAPDEKTEGEIIIREIEARMGGTSRYHHYLDASAYTGANCTYRFSDFAVIYRTHAQAKALEEALMESGIPYQVIGRKSSAQRAEADEIIAYLKSLIRQTEDAKPSEGGAQEEKLLTSADFFDPRADAVALMTLHMAKGLEFKVVFIAGVEEGLVPYAMRKDDVDIEEERRLLYVGMTRAKDELFLLHARNRFLYGQRLTPLPSPFLDEIPEEFIYSIFIPDRVKKQKEVDKQMGLF